MSNSPYLFFLQETRGDGCNLCIYAVSEGIIWIFSKFRINRTFGSKMSECRICRTFRGAKSLNVAIFSKQGSKKFECRIRRTFFFLQETRGDGCNLCIYGGSCGKCAEKFVSKASAETLRRCMQFVHLRQSLRESTGTLKQCRQNARYLILLHQGKHSISGFIAFFQKFGAKSLNCRFFCKIRGKKFELPHLS